MSRIQLSPGDTVYVDLRACPANSGAVSMTGLLRVDTGTVKSVPYGVIKTVFTCVPPSGTNLVEMPAGHQGSHLTPPQDPSKTYWYVCDADIYVLPPVVTQNVMLQPVKIPPGSVGKGVFSSPFTGQNPFADTVGGRLVNIDRPVSKKPIIDDPFPHSCPLCKSKAYVGFSSIECCGINCRNFATHREQSK